MGMGFFPARHHEMMLPVMVLTCHETKEPKPPDARCHRWIIARHAQFHTVGLFNSRNGPTIIARQLGGMCGHHAPQRRKRCAITCRQGGKSVRQHRLIHNRVRNQTVHIGQMGPQASKIDFVPVRARIGFEQAYGFGKSRKGPLPRLCKTCCRRRPILRMRRVIHVTTMVPVGQLGCCQGSPAEQRQHRQYHFRFHAISPHLPRASYPTPHPSRMISIMSHWMQIFDDAPMRTLQQGAVLFRREDRVQSMYLVRSGMVALERPLADGTALTLSIATAGMALAEASLSAQTYHCDAIACTKAEIAVMSRTAFRSALRDRPDAALSLVETMAREVQSQRARIEILRLRRVSERLDAWLDLNGEPAAGAWIKVADQIGVSPPALYRELARRRK